MKKLALLAAAVLCATPSLATPIPANTPPPGLAPTPLLAPSGTLLASSTTTGQALTFSGSLTSAVYQTATGTLDFYYQVARTGAGSTGASDPIGSFTVAPFDSFLVDAFIDPNAYSVFSASTNSGATSTVSRSATGNVLTVSFGADPLTDSQVGPIYIFETNATSFTSGTFGILDGSSLQGMTFAPTRAVPEPATWAMMLLGFGAMGMVIRRRKPALAQLA